MNTTVSCFWRRRETPGRRRGIWAMTGENRGAFFHGDREEIQAPDHSRTWLAESAAAGGGLLDVQVITPDEALAELTGWPEGQRFLQAAFDRHPRI